MATMLERLATIKATAQKRVRKSKKEESSSNMLEASNNVGVIAQKDQQQASERDKLVSDGYALIGVGLTEARVAYGLRVISYARLMSDGKKSKAQEVIDQIGTSIYHMGKDLASRTIGKKVIKERDFKECIDVAAVASRVHAVRQVDWYTALQLCRFIERKGYSPCKPELKNDDDCKQIALLVSTRHKDVVNENNTVDRKLIKALIDDSLGVARKVKSTGKPFPERVAEWLNTADSEEIQDTLNSLSVDIRTALATMLVDGLA